MTFKVSWCPNGPGNGLTWYVAMCVELSFGEGSIGTCTIFPFTINGGGGALDIRTVTQEFFIGYAACPYLETFNYIQTHLERCRNMCRNAWRHIIRANARPIVWWGPWAIWDSCMHAAGLGGAAVWLEKICAIVIHCGVLDAHTGFADV